MSKSIKFNDNNYLDSAGIVHNRKMLENFLVGEIKEFVKQVNVSAINTWYDVGITGNDLETGTYIMEAYTNSSGVNNQYQERLSGIVAWYHSGTNDQTADEIPLSKAGHARNSHNIKFRIVRSRSTETPNNIRLQVSDTIAWSGTGTFTIKFRKII